MKMKRTIQSVRRTLAAVALSTAALGAVAQLPEDTTRAAFVREYFHQGSLTTWLDAMNDHTVMEGLHTGLWNERGQFMVSVDGHSYRWNRFYVDGFRTDNRFQPGSTLYVPSLENYDMRLNTRASAFHFDLDSAAGDYASLAWNRGNLGGISHGTASIIHIFHGTGTEDAYDPRLIQHRQYVRGAATADVAYTLRRADGRSYRQHLLVSAGEQEFPQYDQNGLLPEAPLYGAGAYKVQLDGHLPAGRRLDRLGYLVNVSGVGNYGADFYRNANELADLKTYSASLYGRRGGLTTGLTWSTNVVRHDNLAFSRNAIDQDGESLEPWESDGQTHELSWVADFRRPLPLGLTLYAEAYNSLLGFRPRESHFANDVYLQHALEPEPTPLYHYAWTSRGFAAGLLENRAGVEANRRLNRRLVLSGQLGMTLDGMVLRNKTKISPNLQAALALDWTPARWLKVGLALSHDRVSYNLEDLRYMSDDYMNAEVTYAASGRLFTTTGGRYHHYERRLQQPSYVTVDIPVRLRFGRHEIALLQTYKKFYHTWMTRFVGGTDANGFYDGDYFFLNDGPRDYVVGYQPTELMGTGFLMNTPYYVSQLSRYTYTGRRFLFSLSWQSMIGAGLCALGNGPAANNIGVLSETTANPNTRSVVANAEGKYPGVGRLDQDKAYVCRIYLAYNVCRYFRFGVTGRWTDGQPFSFFNTSTRTDDNGDTQLAIRPFSSRGINPTDGNFGCRESAIFNIDLHAQAQWQAGGHDMQLTLLCYNAYDFGNVLTEFAFPEGIRGPGGRGHNMTLTIPRGLLATLKIAL